MVPLPNFGEVIQKGCNLPIVDADNHSTLGFLVAGTFEQLGLLRQNDANSPSAASNGFFVLQINLAQSGDARGATLAVDLYGTLIRMRTSPQKNSLQFALSLLRRGGKSSVRIGATVRNKLLTRNVASYAEFSRECAEILHPEDAGNFSTIRQLFELLVDEYESAECLPGARRVLAYCNKRFQRTVLVSNSSVYHRKAVDRLGLEGYFDRCFFSCETGVAKPDPRMYEMVIRHSGRPPEDTIFVGDSFEVDYLAPRTLGMQAIHVSKSKRAKHRIESIDHLPLHLFQGGQRHLNEFLRDRDEIGELDFDLFGEDRSRRNPTNMMYVGRKNDRKFVVKFNGSDDTSTIEYIGYQLLKELGLTNVPCLHVRDRLVGCIVVPFLTASHSVPVGGREIFKIGQFAAFSYVFGNIDFRPRNIIITESDTHLIDLEHLFVFKRQFTNTVSREIDPFSKGMMQRAINEFVPRGSHVPDAADAFTAGFNELIAIARHKRDQIQDILLGFATLDVPLRGGLKNHKVPINLGTIDEVARRIGSVDPEELAAHLLPFAPDAMH